MITAVNLGSGDPRRDLELGDGDPRIDPFDLAGVERSGAEMLGRFSAAGNAERDAVARRPALIACRDVAGEERIPGPTVEIGSIWSVSTS